MDSGIQPLLVELSEHDLPLLSAYSEGLLEALTEGEAEPAEEALIDALMSVLYEAEIAMSSVGALVNALRDVEERGSREEGELPAVVTQATAASVQLGDLAGRVEYAESVASGLASNEEGFDALLTVPGRIVGGIRQRFGQGGRRLKSGAGAVAQFLKAIGAFIKKVLGTISNLISQLKTPTQIDEWAIGCSAGVLQAQITFYTANQKGATP